MLVPHSNQIHSSSFVLNVSLVLLYIEVFHLHLFQKKTTLALFCRTQSQFESTLITNGANFPLTYSPLTNWNWLARFLQFKSKIYRLLISLWDPLSPYFICIRKLRMLIGLIFCKTRLMLAPSLFWLTIPQWR